MSKTRAATAPLTLYRLTGIPADLDALLEAFCPVNHPARAQNMEMEVVDLGEIEALFLHRAFANNDASWCPDARALTKLRISYPHHDSGAVLTLALDGHAYALCYGQGHRLVPGELVERGFGRACAARRLHSKGVKTVVRRSVGARSRTDSTLMHHGGPLSALGLEHGTQIVRSLGGATREGHALTYTRRTKRPGRLTGGDGLNVRFGLTGPDLIADIRELARSLREEAPADGLEAVDLVRKIEDPEILAALEADLEARLARNDPADMALVPPHEHIENWQQARVVDLHIGSTARHLDEATLDEVLTRCFKQSAGRRLTALKTGRIHLYSDPRRRERTSTVNTHKCLEVATSLGSRTFHLIEGDWYEFDEAHIAGRRALLTDLFRPVRSLSLPTWDRKLYPKEADYNALALGTMPGFLNLDRKLIAVPGRGRLEICDALGPDDTLIVVKHGGNSKELSHQFAQGVNAARALRQSATTRAEFVALVAEHGGGRTIPADFTPKKMIYAILPARDIPLTPDTLQPFAVLALAEAAETLRGMGIEVEVIGIGTHDPR